MCRVSKDAISSMLFAIKHINYLRAEPDPIKDSGACLLDKKQLPDLQWLKPMQKRRLSAFNKMTLHCAYEAGKHDDEIPVVFSSRHGDLHKTSALLNTLAQNECLSPTAFSMSVHNASAGLLSIFTENRAASNTISAGRDSFVMVLIDAYARINSGVCDKVLVVHCDQAMPNDYLCFQDEQQIDHALAFVMSKDEGVMVSMNSLPRLKKEKKESHLPQSLAFVDFLLSDLSKTTIPGIYNDWQFEVER